MILGNANDLPIFCCIKSEHEHQKKAREEAIPITKHMRGFINNGWNKKEDWKKKGSCGKR